MTQNHPGTLPASALGWLDEGATAGDGTRLWHSAQIAAGATAGAGCTLGKNAFIGTGSVIGDRVKIGNNAGVFGAVIADEVMICPGALLLEDPAPRATTPSGQRKGPADWTRRPVSVHAGATIGAGAVIAPGVTVGTRAMVAVGAARRAVPPGQAGARGNDGGGHRRRRGRRMRGQGAGGRVIPASRPRVQAVASFRGYSTDLGVRGRTQYLAPYSGSS